MAEEYNSKLISDLYHETDDDKIIDLLDEIGEIKDPHFLYPLYDKYKQLAADEDSFISHYFIGSIATLKTDDAKLILTNIALDSNTSDTDFLFSLEYLSKFDAFDEKITSRAEVILYTFDYKKQDDYSLIKLLSYLKKAEKLIGFADNLQQAFQNKEYKSDIRRVALWYLLRINPSEYLKYYLDEYGQFKTDPRGELILAKEIKNWKGKLTSELKDKMLKGGGARVKELLMNQRRAEIEENQNLVEIEYPNADIITEIYSVRRGINSLALVKFGFEILNESEILYKQTPSVKERADLISVCMDLREFIQGISEKCKTNIGFNEAVKIIPTIRETDMMRSLNRLHLFLSLGGITVTPDLYGIKLLHQLLSKIAHPKAEQELIKYLEKLNLVEAYKQEDFSNLHRELLKNI